ncbi:MAG: polysaccharide biosynthesis/export family protein [bacterium]
MRNKIHILLPFILFMCGCISVPRPYVPSENQDLSFENIQENGEDYIIQRGDTVGIKFFYNPELNDKVIVRPDGKIALQLIDQVEVAGLTSSQLDDILTEKYSRFRKDPEITVNLVSFSDQRVYVGGEVGLPQIVHLQGRMTALQAILYAGGFRETAEMRNVLVLRNIGSPDYKVLTVDHAQLFDNSRMIRNDIVLEPRDIVFVPKTLIAEANKFVSQYINLIIPKIIAVNLLRVEGYRIDLEE